MKTCIAFPNKVATYSETFITAHIKNLELDFSIASGWRPYLDLQEGSIFKFPMSCELIRVLVKNITPGTYSKLYDKSFANYLKNNQIGTVLAEYGITGVNILNACKSTNTKLVVHFHGFDAFHYDIVRKYKDRYFEMFEYAKAIVVVSEDMKNQLVSLGAPPVKIFNVTCGIDIQKFYYSKPYNLSPVFIAVGRFALKKAPQITIRAFSRVLSEVPDAYLVMVGDGSLLKECRKLADELDINNNITFKGVLKPDEIIACLKKSSCFVQHSVRSTDGDSEGLPVSILEAAACGLPIISTFHAGIKEAVRHGVSGYLTNEGDEIQMANYMIELAKNPELAYKMGLKGRELVAGNYNSEKQIKELKDIILR